jgi:hypothetical protein
MSGTRTKDVTRRSSRIANIPASVTTFRRSAPLKPSESCIVSYYIKLSPAVYGHSDMTNLDDRLVVNLAALVHGCSMNLQNLKTSLLIRKRDFDFAVETAGPEEGGVKSVGSVGGHNEFCSAESVEAVHLVQQLYNCKWLGLSISLERETE